MQHDLFGSGHDLDLRSNFIFDLNGSYYTQGEKGGFTTYVYRTKLYWAMEQNDTNTAQYSSMLEKRQSNDKLFTVWQMIMLSLRPWRDSAAFCISLLAVMFHWNMDIAELVSTNRLKMVIFLIINFRGTKYPASEKWGKWITLLTMHTCTYILLIHIQNTAHAVLKLSLCRAPAEPGMSPSFWPYYEEVLCTCIGKKTSVQIYNNHDNRGKRTCIIGK